MALTLAGVLFASISGFFRQTIYNQKQLNAKVTAMVLGQGKLAELICGGEPGMSGDFPAPYQQYHWSAAEETTAGGDTITLTVEWRDGNALRQETTFTGYRAPE